MRKRKYTKIQKLLPEIRGMLSEVKSHGEIERPLGLTGDCHCSEYPVSVMCHFFGVSRSGYYSYLRRNCKDADADLAEVIRTQQDNCHATYGHRRMKIWLDSKQIHRNPKNSFANYEEVRFAF